MTSKSWIQPLLGRGRWPLVVVVALLTAVLGRWAADSRLELSNESMNARVAAQEEVWNRFVESFGSGEAVVMALQDERLLEPDGLSRLARVAERVESIDGVHRVLSLTGAVEVLPGAFGATEVPFLPPGVTPDRAVLEQALDRNPQWTDLLVSRDRRTAGLLIEVEERPGDDAFRPRIVGALRTIKTDLGKEGIEAHVTGVMVQQHDTTRFVARDLRVLLPASIVVLGLALVWVTRCVSGVLLPLSVTGVALIWTVGIHSALGFRMNIITSLLPPVVMVLSISTAIHIYQEWVTLGSVEPDGKRLIVAVVGAMATPCTLTAATTALGLASLATSSVPAVREFGLFGALGVMLSLLLNLTLLPLALSWQRPPQGHIERGSRLGMWLPWIGDLTVRRPKTILAVTAAITLVALAGIAQVRNNTDLVRFLDSDSELVRDTLQIDRKLVGTNALDLMIERTDSAPLTDPDDVRRIDRLTREIVALEPVTTVVSITDTLARVGQAEWDLPRPTLPEDPEDLLYLYDLLEASPRREDLRRLITDDWRRARLAVRIHAGGTADAQELIEEIESLAAGTLGGTLTARPTGAFYTLAVGSNRLVESQLTSFALALGMVFLALGLVFRCRRIMIAAAAPNLMPIIWVGGLMGWLGVDLSTATAMVASVAIGIAVDDTIHYLTRFRQEHRGDIATAIRRTTLSTGRVLFIASTVLTLGFWAGAFGSFRPTIWFSLLTGGTIMTALACDLLVLPACLVLTRPKPAGSSDPG